MKRSTRSPFDLHLLLREVEVSRADALVGAALGLDVVEQVVVDHHERGAGPAVTQLDPFGELRACGAADGAAGDPGDAELLDPVLGDQVELVGVPGDRDRRVLVRPGPAGQGVLDRGAAELLPELLQPDHIGGARTSCWRPVATLLTLLDFSTFHDAARNASLASGFPDGTGTTSPPVASPPPAVHCCWAARLDRNAIPGPQLAASTVSNARTRPAAIALLCRVDTAVTAAWAGPGRVAGGCLQLAARGAGPVQRRLRLTPR